MRATVAYYKAVKSGLLCPAPLLVRGARRGLQRHGIPRDKLHEGYPKQTSEKHHLVIHRPFWGRGCGFPGRLRGSLEFYFAEIAGKAIAEI